MTYNVFGGTLSLTQSINQLSCITWNSNFLLTLCSPFDVESAINTLATTYEISRTPSVLFSRDVRVTSYLTPLRTTFTQRPYKL